MVVFFDYINKKRIIKYRKDIQMKHSTNSVVTQTMAYLECSYFLVFTLALAYNQMPYSRQIVEKEIEKWHKTDFIQEWLGDFCLDVLAGRTKVSLEVKDWRKNESKTVERNAN